MVTRQEFTVPSSDGIHQLHVMAWSPEGSPRGVVQISHGIAEHIGRYDQYATVLAEHGYYVVGNDHLGHGHTATPEDLGYTAEKAGWFKMCADLERVQQRVKKEYPDLPYALLGHSMGSFLARTFLICYPGKVDACILAGTGQEPSAVVSAGAVLAKAANLKIGGRGKSDFLEKLMFGSYNKNFAPARTAYDWLSRDPLEVDKYIADPLAGFQASTQLVQDLMTGLEFIWNRKNQEKMNRNTPVFFCSGDMDPVGGCGKQVRKVYQRFLDLGCKDVTVKLYPQARHELHNELNREEVYRDVLRWLEEKL